MNGCIQWYELSRLATHPSNAHCISKPAEVSALLDLRKRRNSRHISEVGMTALQSPEPALC